LRKVQYSTMLHVRQAHLVCYVMDAFNAFRVDDFVLINRVIEEGRPIIIVVNKWEAIKEQYKNKARQFLMTQLDKNLGQLHGHPIVFVSAKMALNIDQMMDKIITTYDKWNKRISTGLLNNWL
jgi:GTP-binding protein